MRHALLALIAPFVLAALPASALPVRPFTPAALAEAQAANQPILVVFQSSRYCPLTSSLPMRYADELRRMDGVDSVLPTLLFINSCRTNLDLVTFVCESGSAAPE